MVIVEYSRSEAYSARNMRVKCRLPYSVLYPDTSSASASGRSKGVLFVSASMQM